MAFWNYGFPVSTLLYPLRQIYYQISRYNTDATTKQAASQQSGIKRPLHAPGISHWIAKLMSPLFLIQHTSRYKNLGDGWIVLARKPA
jgi:hypothetical protein